MANRSREERSRTPAWLAIATVVHAALIAALFVTPLRRPADVGAPPAADSSEIAIVVEGEPAAEQGRSGEPTGATAEARPSSPGAASRPRARGDERSATAAGAGAPSTASGVPERSSEPSVAGGPEGPPGGASSAAPNGGVTSPNSFTAAELGIAGHGGQNPFLPRAEEKMPTTGPDHPAARAMRGTGLGRDRELGLGPEGPAIRALADATSSSIAPLRGRAVFVVRTSSDGVVSGIELLDSEGGSGWLDAGRIALESLRGKKMAVPRGASAMTMRIEVRSEMKLPNGENAPAGARRGENDMPELTLPDISNLGAKPRRVVHARAVGTELL